MPKNFFKSLNFKKNKFHPLTLINGSPKIGNGTYIGAFSEINSKGAKVTIGENCDIASFVSINVADSHKRCIKKKKEIERQNITIGNNVFVGSHSVILGGVLIGNNSVVAAGTVLRKCKIPANSLVIGNPYKIKKNYYK